MLVLKARLQVVREEIESGWWRVAGEGAQRRLSNLIKKERYLCDGGLDAILREAGIDPAEIADPVPDPQGNGGRGRARG